ncbi:MAG: hypothetical protein PVG39_13235 [Desulfobacteraceae bacterium]|jgi:REP element-mobilizing transposase RayT
MEKYMNKYRIPPARLQNWDYGWNAAYFITICTKNRECFFGNIDITNDVETQSTVATRCIVETQCIASLQNQPQSHTFRKQQTKMMQLSEIGKIVESEWIKTPEIRFDMNLELGAFVVMPNHFHAIIIIGKNKYNTKNVMDNTNTPHCRDAMHCVSTVDQNNIYKPQNQFGPQLKNLASILRGFKSSLTTQARKINPDFAWQPRFHDHIIRDEASHQQIAQYTISNPQNWEKDEFFRL